ncbi:MAG: hypothetical protein SPI72_04360 [Porphyromonas sp.]|nr:hypothetical protein [Porphyromonas sp.]
MKQKSIVIAAIVLCVAAVVLGGIFWWGQRSLQKEREHFAQIEKEQMMDELYELSEQYNMQYNKLSGTNTEGQLKITNDSIMQQLISERAKVDRLTEELASVKNDNLKRIGQLQAEVKTLRTILRSYVVQIDSLHATNERLRVENKQVRADYQRVEAEAGRLKQEREVLTDKVTLAAKLNAVGISVNPLNKKGKTSKRIDKITDFAVSFTVAHNVTAEPGPKTIYLRLVMPTGQAMGEKGTFRLEGKDVGYTEKKDIEYTGEDMPITIYKQVTESLPAGQYRVYLFADGNQIGRTSFELKD